MTREDLLYKIETLEEKISALAANGICDENIFQNTDKMSKRELAEYYKDLREYLEECQDAELDEDEEYM